VQVSVTITENTFHNNTKGGIVYTDHPSAEWELIPDPPTIIHFDLEAGIVSGQICDSCLVEIFSTESSEGEIFEGSTTANQYGYFIYRKGEALAGPLLVATARHEGEKTSVFSSATPMTSDIQIALDFIQADDPLYQINFDSSNQVNTDQNIKVENGKLIASSVIGFKGTPVSRLSSDRFAVEFEVQMLEADSSNSRCYFSINNDIEGEFQRGLGVAFRTFGRVSVEHYAHPNSWPIIHETSSIFDFSVSNKVTLVFLGDQIAAFIDGQLAYTILDPDGSAYYSNQDLAAEDSVTCEFDNYKIWDLDVID